MEQKPENTDHQLSYNITEGDFSIFIQEHRQDGELMYHVYINRPEDFHAFNELERPLLMAYDPTACRLRFISQQDVSDFKDLEYFISNRLHDHVQ